jgi:hypothetical protein
MARREIMKWAKVVGGKMKAVICGENIENNGEKAM